MANRAADHDGARDDEEPFATVMPPSRRPEDLGIVLLEQAARTSNESELFRAIPDAFLTVVSNRPGWQADREVVLKAIAPPGFAGHEAWTASPAWFRGLNDLDPGHVDMVASLEMFSFSSLQANRLARRLGVPHAVTVAETMTNNPLYRVPPWALITKHLRHEIDLFICYTEKARTHAIELGCPPERCRILPLGVDTEVFHPAPELVRRPAVLFVGMFRANRGADKGVIEIVEACRRLAHSDIPDLELQLVGDGHLRPELEAIAAQESFLSVLPPMPRDKIPALMRDQRLLVLASKQTFKWEEQFGYVLVEAMSSGLPVVSTRSGAIPEVVPDWNPLVAEGDVDALVGAIRRALGPDGEDLGRRNREAAVDRYELTTLGAKLRELIVEFSSAKTRSSVG